ncbi:MAG: T9SS type A sorting domain-containing protein [Flavobacteriales bacterium]|nr:T9SS type A sorting domain-containing protein [Flavobacteriales bacterium]
MPRSLRLLRSFILSSSVFFLPAVSFAQVEQEPNDTQQLANFVALQDTISGVSCAEEDWFRTTSAVEGRVTFWLEVTNPGLVPVLADILIYSSTNGATQITNAFEVVPPASTVVLSGLALCNGSGDYWAQIRGYSDCVTYRLCMNWIPAATTNEVEPNGTFGQATFLAEMDTARGNIFYLNAALDVYDWWRVSLPTHGTVEVYFEATNTSSGITFYDFVTYQDDGITQGSGFNTLTVPAGATLSNTFTFRCIAPGNYFLRVEAGACGAYKLRYRLLDTFVANEQEPNAVFTQANLIADGDTARGHIAYTNVAYDQYDWWRAELPEHGTVEVYFEATNTSNGITFYDFVTYQNDGITQGSGFNTLTVPAGATLSNTFTFRCIAPGNYFFRVEGGACGNYRLSYRMVDVQANEEQEPNNTFIQAQPLVVGDTIYGHIWHSNASPVDPSDYYTLDLSDSMNVRIEWEATMGTTGAGSFQITPYSPSQAILGYRATSTTYQVPVRDSLLINCYTQGSMVVHVAGNSCHAYKLWVTEQSCATVGIPERNWTPFVIHPNPAEGIVHITAAQGFHGSELAVRDAQGRVVHRQRVTLGQGTSLALDLSGLAAGTYTVSINFADGGTGTQRLVLMR